MGYYFDDSLSIRARNSADVRSTLRTVAGRYIGENPPSAPIFRLSSEEGIFRIPDYRYVFDFSEKYPDAPDFSVAYAWGALKLEAAKTIPLAISIGGPLKAYLNGRLVFKSHIGHERTADQRHFIEVEAEAGWNNFVLEFTKTPRGFGGVFGTSNKKSFAFHFLSPSAEGIGREGWLYTGPLDGALPALPSFGDSEASTGVEWLPRRAWNAAELAAGVYERLFGREEGRYARSWTKGDFRQGCPAAYRFSGSAEGAFRLWVAGLERFETEKGGSFSFDVQLPYGTHDIVVESRCGKAGWDFRLEAEGPSGPVRFRLPVSLQNNSQEWLHGGPFGEKLATAHEFTDLRRPLKTLLGPSYFRIDLPGSLIRPFMESGNYGHWHYPLGVTLYGLLVAGRVLESADIEIYAQHHLQTVADWYEYVLWDGRFYGASSMLHLLFQMDTLDDCGSGGASLLEAVLRVGLDNFRPLADDIAGYIRDRQERLPDGAFFRNKKDNPFMAGTVWADDLYMSVPFMVRYWRLSSDDRFLEDAVNQFRLYRKYLLMKERGILAHVYDVTASLSNNIAWGRGNGWAMFSLCELLTVLPKEHPAYGEMMGIYRDLSRSYKKLQDGQGMWHQVLTDHSSYPEASCTSMFLYSFARGLRLGWLDEVEFGDSARRAWTALCSNAVDYRGNVYGICRGTGFSFTESYYRDELNWILSDLHGIGIILLAGAEFLELELSRSNWAD